jgi:hypothetical protein
LYNKKPFVTEIMSGETMDFLGILEGDDGSIWFGSGGGVYRYNARMPDGQRKTLTDYKSKENQELRPSPLFRSKGYLN